MSEPISAMVLAGGKSRRLGTDKVLLDLGLGKSLLEAAVAVMGQVADEVLVVIGPDSGYSAAGATMVTDVYPGKGSLGGIYSGLLNCRYPHCLVVACDMPFLNTDLLGYMVAQPRDYDVLIPRLDEVLEPLHAIYSKRCLPYARELLERNHLKIIDFFDQVRVEYIEQAAVDRFDPQHLSFFNVNTPGQLAKAREILKRNAS